MKKFTIAVLVVLVAVAVAAPSFAKEMKIARFTGSVVNTGHRGADKDASEVEALRKAEVWLKQNHQYIHVISHSATGNYHGSSYCYGFSTVTILYEELGVKGMQ